MAGVLLDLEKFGPRSPRAPLDLRASQDYCRRLATSHYENFTVASWLLPRELRPHFYHVYAYCRWADDLADETANPQQSAELLDWWEQQLHECYRGRAVHPVFIALTNTVERFTIPQQPFLDLLTAFRQDQATTRYETFDELLAYCRNSANPVGRLVLYLGSCFEPETARLSDSICTGLQLANFWQDVANDYDRGRIYLPRESQRRFGYDEAMFARREYNSAFAAMLEYEVARAEQFFSERDQLAERVPAELRIDVDLFSKGGLAVLAAIRHVRYNVWRRRPQVSKTAKLRLLLSAWLGSRTAPTRGSSV